MLRWHLLALLSDCFSCFLSITFNFISFSSLSLSYLSCACKFLILCLSIHRWMHISKRQLMGIFEMCFSEQYGLCNEIVKLNSVCGKNFNECQNYEEIIIGVFHFTFCFS